MEQLGWIVQSKEVVHGKAGRSERRIALGDFLQVERAMRYCPGDLHGGIHLVPDVACEYVLGGI